MVLEATRCTTDRYCEVSNRPCQDCTVGWVILLVGNTGPKSDERVPDAGPDPETPPERNDSGEGMAQRVFERPFGQNEDGPDQAQPLHSPEQDNVEQQSEQGLPS